MREPMEDRVDPNEPSDRKPLAANVLVRGLPVRAFTAVAGENPEPPRPLNTSWGVGPWPVQRSSCARQWPTCLTTLCRRSLRAITFHQVRTTLNSPDR